jgi:hypothetical protein
MPKLTVTRHDFLPNHRRRRFAEMVNDSEQPFDAALDYFVCGGQERPMQDSEAPQEQVPLDEHPHGAKRSRQRVAAKSNMLHLFDPS